MINYDKHFATVSAAAAFIASCCTCFTCPLSTDEADACKRGEYCEQNIERWLCKRLEDE